MPLKGAQIFINNMNAGQKKFASNTWSDLPKAARNAIVIGVIAIAVIAVIVIRKKIKDKASLIQVQVNKENIPHYKRADLNEFLRVCCNGGTPKPGRSAMCETKDPKRVGCAWVPKVLEWMDKNNTNVVYMWHPQLIAKRLFEEMKGIAWSQAAFNLLKGAVLGPIAYMTGSSTQDSMYSTREGLFRSIAALNPDQVRWLHNWWSVHHAENDNLYTWIDGESGVSRAIRNQAMAAMDRAGVGSDIISSRKRTS